MANMNRRRPARTATGTPSLGIDASRATDIDALRAADGGFG